MNCDDCPFTIQLYTFHETAKRDQLLVLTSEKCFFPSRGSIHLIRDTFIHMQHIQPTHTTATHTDTTTYTSHTQSHNAMNVHTHQLSCYFQ